MKQKRVKIRKWYRYIFADNTFIYLPKTFSSLKVLYREKKEHGRIINKKEVGLRKI